VPRARADQAPRRITAVGYAVVRGKAVEAAPSPSLSPQQNKVVALLST
jgi:hypothetical protein